MHVHWTDQLTCGVFDILIAVRFRFSVYRFRFMHIPLTVPTTDKGKVDHSRKGRLARLCGPLCGFRVPFSSHFWVPSLFSFSTSPSLTPPHGVITRAQPQCPCAAPTAHHSQQQLIILLNAHRIVVVGSRVISARTCSFNVEHFATVGGRQCGPDPVAFSVAPMDQQITSLTDPTR
ncbi:hypothetical protein BC827DRAFT_1189448 [Russula dissimulans]|nr:hypothetical protein BC827DRAFT_1189448 [Russula dissimulans]